MTRSWNELGVMSAPCSMAAHCNQQVKKISLLPGVCARFPRVSLLDTLLNSLAIQP